MKDAIAIGQGFSRTPALCNIPCRRQQDVAPAKCGAAKRDLYPKSAPVLGSTEPLEHDGFACRRPLQHGCCVPQRVGSNTCRQIRHVEFQQFSSSIAEHLTHTLIDIENCTGVGIIDHDGVVDGRKDGAEALLALAQLRLRSLSIRDVAEETDAPDGVSWGLPQRAGVTLECSSVLEAKVAVDWHVRIFAEPENFGSEVLWIRYLLEYRRQKRIRIPSASHIGRYFPHLETFAIKRRQPALGFNDKNAVRRALDLTCKKGVGQP